MIFEPLKDPRAHQGPKWEPFWRDLTSIFIDFHKNAMRESACKIAFAMVCIIRSALLPAQFPTGLVAVWAQPSGYSFLMKIADFFHGRVVKFERCGFGACLED